MRFSTRHSVIYPLVTLGGVLLTGTAGSADDRIAHIRDEVDTHFEQASENFGDGVVQMHSRSKSAEGNTHVIYQFDCTQKHYGVLYSGLGAPDDFPMQAWDGEPAPIEPDGDVAPLAEHACVKHGYPLLKW